MFNLFSGQRAPKKPGKKGVSQATIDYYNDKIKWLTTGHQPTQLLILVCRDIPAPELAGVSARDPQPFVKKALRYYKKKLRELA